MVSEQCITHKMILPILTDENPQLREISAPVKTIDASTKKLIKDLIDTLASQRGVGIAAPQTGIKQRVIICKIRSSREKEEDIAMINPQILTKSKQCEIAEEGCFSIPNIFGPVNRPSEITVQYQTIDKKTVLRRFTGYNARVIQHEVDHLDGILFTDLVSNKAELYEEISY
jgi:peptide deformylase